MTDYKTHEDYRRLQAIFNPSGQPFGETNPDDDAPVAA